MVRVSKEIYTDEFLFKDVCDFSEKLGRTPTVLEYRRSPIARQRFGSWSKFLEKAGLSPREKYKNTDEMLIKEVQSLAKRLGRTPKFSEYAQRSVIYNRFGTWAIFLKKAGLTPRGKVRYTDEELFNEVRELEREFDKVPKARDYPRYFTVRRRFGSWDNFIEAYKKMK